MRDDLASTRGGLDFGRSEYRRCLRCSRSLRLQHESSAPRTPKKCATCVRRRRLRFPRDACAGCDRRYTVSGESKLTDYRSNLSREQALTLDRRIATFLGVDPSETEDRVRLTLDLSREMSIERLLESLLTFLRRVNGGMLGGVATYTICADDGRLADEAQIEQAL